MTLKDQLHKIGSEINNPCVTISFNTHRTHPDNVKDEVLLKNLLKEAKDRVTEEFGKRPIASLLEKLENVSDKIDINYNLDSMHIFLSNDTEEIVRSAWETTHEGVHVSDRFAVRPLMKSYSRSVNYLLMLLSQSGVQLYEASNASIINEIINEDFPFMANTHSDLEPDRASDAKVVDNMVREYLNKVDKALVKMHNDTGLQVVVICTEENYTFLQQVADKPSIYLGYSALDYNNSATHQIVKQSWEIISSLEQQRRRAAIEEIKEAVGQGKVLTDLQEIYQAAIDGRGDLLIIHQDFAQPVIMKDERTFDILSDATKADAIDDISSNIAWEVISRKGRVIFTTQEEVKDLGEIVLKTRY